MPTTAPHPSPSTIGRLLAALDTSLYLAAPPGRNRLARILGFYYIMARILVTFVAGLLFAAVGGLVPSLKPTLTKLLLLSAPKDTLTQKYHVPT